MYREAGVTQLLDATTLLSGDPLLWTYAARFGVTLGPVGNVTSLASVPCVSLTSSPSYGISFGYEFNTRIHIEDIRIYFEHHYL